MEKQCSSFRWDLASTYVLCPLETAVFNFRGAGVRQGYRCREVLRNKGARSWS